MFLKLNAEEIAQRFRDFWKQEDTARIICQINVREKPLPRGSFMRYIPDVLRMLEDHLDFFETRKRVLDDTLPVIAPNFGAGFDAGYFGAEVRYGHGTSFPSIVMSNVTDIESVDWSVDNEHTRFFLESVAYFRRECEGKAWVGVPPLLNPADIAFYLVGTDMFYYMNDVPDEVHHLLGKITDKFVRLEDLRIAALKPDSGGLYQSWMNWWVPGRAITIGDDQLFSCSADVYREFGLPYQQRIIDHLGSGWYHLHTNGVHLLREIAKLKGLICLEISDDPNTASRGLELLPEVRRILGDIPVRVAIGLEEFRNGLKTQTLVGNVIYNVCGESYSDIWDITIEEANELWTAACEYRSQASEQQRRVHKARQRSS